MQDIMKLWDDICLRYMILRTWMMAQLLFSLFFFLCEAACKSLVHQTSPAGQNLIKSFSLKIK